MSEQVAFQESVGDGGTVDGHEPGLAQVFQSSPGEGGESARLMYLLSIACAKESVRIAASYFVPDNLSIGTLLAARRRGVLIEIMVPGRKTDVEIARKASRSRWGELLKDGIEIYE